MPLNPAQAIRGVIEAKRRRGEIKTQEDEYREWDRLCKIWEAHNPELQVSSRKTTSDPEKGSI